MNKLRRLNLNSLKNKPAFKLVWIGLILFLILILWNYISYYREQVESGRMTEEEVPPIIRPLIKFIPKVPDGLKTLMQTILTFVIPLVMVAIGFTMFGVFPIVGAVLMVGGLIIGASNLWLNARDKANGITINTDPKGQNEGNQRQNSKPFGKS